MSVIKNILKDIPFPKMVKIKQKFNPTHLENLIEKLQEELQQREGMDQIKAGYQVGICVGSRGVANIDTVTKTVVEAIKEKGAIPFIVPCMGSHGGATAEGQKEVLEHLGVSEETMGAPIKSSMEVIQVDALENGLPIYVDKYCAEADAIIVINRVKPHTAFRGPIESGLMKMITIGLGKQKGAESCHQMGFKYMAEIVPKAARKIMQKVPIVFGVALVENAYDKTCVVEVVPSAQIEKRETQLLIEAKARMPRFLFDQMDVLVLDYIGKNVSGDGMDPNITGKYPTPYARGGPDITKVVVLDLTPETGGNGNGVGIADFTTKSVVDKMDLEITYANGLTSTVCTPTKIATYLENDEYAIKAAIKTCNILDYNQCRLVRIKDTLHLGEIEISEAMLEEVKKHEDIEIISEPYEWQFDENGNLLDKE
ncbi:MAG: hypothetical protein JM58_10645 [Peptococcaceae bacterium BICA1-8]|nr:MAG: hypothetical protein JM58_10645 [Peptococcaceae bacterium BICA1-8]